MPLFSLDSYPADCLWSFLFKDTMDVRNVVNGGY